MAQFGNGVARYPPILDESRQKVCGFALTQTGRLAQLRARVLRFGDPFIRWSKSRRRGNREASSDRRGGPPAGVSLRTIRRKQPRSQATPSTPPLREGNQSAAHHRPGRWAPAPGRSKLVAAIADGVLAASLITRVDNCSKKAQYADSRPRKC